MPVASLPSRHGCGSFGKEAYEFVDMIHEDGFSIWQILPLNPRGYGNSPYQPYSSYALDEIFIDLDLLYEKGYLAHKPAAFNRNAEQVDYDAVRKFKEPYLREAFRKFEPDLNYTNFAYQDWMKNYAVFKTLKQVNGNRSWVEWPEEMKDGSVDMKPYQDEILYQIFLQYILFLQWKDLKQYANDRDILIMGDIPFYVGLDSSDVFFSRKNFLLDDDGRPTFIAGVPPDYFSANGQRWGNPIYDWDYMEKDGFSFWISRLAYTQRLFDIIRVDHFRAFDTYWKIKASCPTAVDGEWVEAPGYKLFDTIKEKLPDLQLVAEDLGDLREQVHTLRDHYDFRGMRVIQFSFNADGMGEDREHLLVYTGTHDNESISSWYRKKPGSEKRKMRKCMKKMGYKTGSFTGDVIDYSLHSNADMVIIPMGDWIHKGTEARINMPGTIGSPNWMWRMTDFSDFRKRTNEIRDLIEKSGRGGGR